MNLSERLFNKNTIAIWEGIDTGLHIVSLLLVLFLLISFLGFLNNRTKSKKNTLIAITNHILGLSIILALLSLFYKGLDDSLGRFGTAFIWILTRINIWAFLVTNREDTETKGDTDSLN